MLFFGCLVVVVVVVGCLQLCVLHLLTKQLKHQPTTSVEILKFFTRLLLGVSTTHGLMFGSGGAHARR